MIALAPRAAFGPDVIVADDADASARSTARSTRCAPQVAAAAPRALHRIRRVARSRDRPGCVAARPRRSARRASRRTRGDRGRRQPRRRGARAAAGGRSTWRTASSSIRSTRARARTATRLRYRISAASRAARRARHGFVGGEFRHGRGLGQWPVAEGGRARPGRVADAPNGRATATVYFNDVMIGAKLLDVDGTRSVSICRFRATRSRAPTICA